MITEIEFKDQLQSLNSHIQRTLNNGFCSNQGDSLAIKIISSAKSNPTKSLEILITYSASYNCPILHFKTFHTVEESDPFLNTIETIRAIYTTNPYEFLNIPEIDSPYDIKSVFQITLTDFDNSNWWMIHPCDSENFLQNSNNEEFLINWWSLYSKIFDYFL